MTRGITSKEPDPRQVYADIIDLPPWRSPTRTPMPLADRAAQFAPFAALTGFSDMISEESRFVDRKMELSEEDLDLLNQQLQVISEELSRGRHPTLTVTFFSPDPLKSGGRYESVTAPVRKLDPSGGRLVLAAPEGTNDPPLSIAFSDLYSLSEED